MANIVVIGGGAAGFFAAIAAARKKGNTVVILEKSSKVLSKVRVSGGGRCNVTHSCFEIPAMLGNYPRGAKLLRTAFNYFFAKDTIEWYEKRGCKLKTEADGRMFPVSNNSQSIIDVLMHEIDHWNIKIRLNHSVESIEKEKNGFVLRLADNKQVEADKIIIAAGGFPKTMSFDWIKRTGHAIIDPVPSLFTFNIPNEPITKLMGVSLPNAKIKIGGSKMMQEGPLLITHWGLSGPAILKLSSFGARKLSELNYDFKIIVTWDAGFSFDTMNEFIYMQKKESPRKKVTSISIKNISSRLWEYLLERSGIDTAMNWADVPNKQLNALVNRLVADEYHVKGKTTFKEEFVTCGGVDLGDVDFKTLESKKVPGLYFCGEVLDIDGITGGFNFQAAWTTGYLAGTHASGVESQDLLV